MYIVQGTFKYMQWVLRLLGWSNKFQESQQSRDFLLYSDSKIIPDIVRIPVIENPLYSRCSGSWNDKI